MFSNEFLESISFIDSSSDESSTSGSDHIIGARGEHKFIKAKKI